MFAKEDISVMSDFGVDLNEEVLEFGLLGRQLVKDEIVVEDVFHVGGVIRVVFRIFLYFFSFGGFILRYLRVKFIVLIKILIFGYLLFSFVHVFLIGL